MHQSLIGQENLGLQGELLSTKRVQRSDKLQREMMVRKLMNDELHNGEDDIDYVPIAYAQKKRRLTAAESPSP